MEVGQIKILRRQSIKIEKTKNIFRNIDAGSYTIKICAWCPGGILWVGIYAPGYAVLYDIEAVV